VLLLKRTIPTISMGYATFRLWLIPTPSRTGYNTTITTTLTNMRNLRTISSHWMSKTYRSVKRVWMPESSI
jgi:hypothetical protein